MLPGLGKTGGLFAGLRDLRARGLIKAVSLGMDTGNAPAGQRDTRALGIIDLIREAPEVRLTSTTCAASCYHSSINPFIALYGQV